MSKAQKPLLSICVPTYNRAELLRQTLDHLADKLDPSNEIVVSNNCSTDHTIDVLEDFAKKWDNFRYITQAENIHVSENCNAVQLLAKGKYSYTLCDDDMLYIDAITKAMQILEQHQDVAAVFGSYKEWFPDTGRTEDYIHSHELDYYPKGSKKEIFNKYVYLWLPLIRTEIAQRFTIHANNKNSWGFWASISKILDHGGIMIVPDFFYKHRQTEKRLEHNLTEGWFHDMYRADFELYLGQLEHGNIQNAEFITNRTAGSYVQGARFAIEKKQWLKAHDFFIRARAYGRTSDDNIKKLEEKAMLHMTVERIGNLVRLAPGVRKIIFESHIIVDNIIKLLQELIPDIEIIQVAREELINRPIDPDDFIISWEYDTLKEISEKTEIDPLRQCSLKDLFNNNLVVFSNVTFE